MFMRAECQLQHLGIVRSYYYAGGERDLVANITIVEPQATTQVYMVCPQVIS